MSSEFEVMIQSHRFLSKFLTTIDKFSDDEIIFIEFRPYYIRNQRLVYNNMLTSQCVICMHDYFSEMIVLQHDHRHPTMCCKCYEKMLSCPFCRMPLIRNIVRLVS